MDISPYLESVRTGVTNAAALADEHTQQVAQRLGAAIGSSTRLALIAALSDAAGAISAEIAPASVEVRLVGQDPELVVSVPQAPTEPTMLLPENEPTVTLDEPLGSDDDEPLARISLRLPTSVKSRVDKLADEEGISTNAWLTRAIMDSLGGRNVRQPPTRPGPPGPADFLGGFGPFGPHGVFGPNGVFGIRPDRPDRPGRPERPARPEHPERPEYWQGGRGNNVQGWVR